MNIIQFSRWVTSVRKNKSYYLCNVKAYLGAIWLVGIHYYKGYGLRKRVVVSLIKLGLSPRKKRNLQWSYNDNCRRSYWIVRPPNLTFVTNVMFGVMTFYSLLWPESTLRQNYAGHLKTLRLAKLANWRNVILV